MNASKIRLIVISATVSLGALLYFLIDARHTHFFPHCPFNTLTGLYCPGCGSQRAISSLLHGDVMQAIGFNVLMVASLPVLVYAAGVNVYNAFAAKPVQQQVFYSTWFVRILLFTVVFFWIARNVPVYPFNLLAPHATL